MIEARDYQLEAVESVREWLAKGKRRPLVQAATGSGKSVMIALIAEGLLKRGDGRLLIACHQSEILEQNAATIEKLTGVKCGIYCAGLGRKETAQRIILASRDSLGNNPTVCGVFPVIIFDEAHLVSIRPKEKLTSKLTNYEKIYYAQIDPIVVGFIGSPWRLDGGAIYGQGKFFDVRVTQILPRTLIDRGYLSDYSFPAPKELVDTSNVSVSKMTGDFDEVELSNLYAKDSVVDQAILHWFNHAKDRICTIFFCISIAHAEMVCEALETFLDKKDIVLLTGNTKKADRAKILDRAKAGGFRAIVNVGVLTTGVDIPVIDTICLLRPTKSASLFVQMCGRGLRLHHAKSECLILDMGGNFQRFQSLDDPHYMKKGEPDDTRVSLALKGAPTKECPECGGILAASAKVCFYCDHVFVSHDAEPWTDGGWLDISHVTAHTAMTKSGKPCVIANFYLVDKKPVYFVKKWYVFNGDYTCHPFVKKQLKELAQKKVLRIKAKNLSETFPEIMDISFSPNEPGIEIKDEINLSLAMSL